MHVYISFIYVTAAEEQGHLTNVNKFLEKASSKWLEICTNLRIKQNTIVNLKDKSSPEVSLIGGLKEWLQLKYNYQEYGKPTWRKVAESVVKINNGDFKTTF